MAEPAKDVEGLVVTVTVDEGESYDLGEVKFEGAAGFKPEDLRKTADLKTGDVVNFDLVHQGVERVKRLLRRNGYLQAEAAVDRKVDDKRKAVDLLVRLTEGPQYTFGKLESGRPGPEHRGGHPQDVDHEGRQTLQRRLPGVLPEPHPRRRRVRQSSEDEFEGARE